MCLDTVKEKYENPSPLIQSGYKVFRGSGNSLQFQAQTLGGAQTLTLDKWIVAEEKQITANDQKSYITGFHICIDEKEVERYERSSRSRRVYFRYAHTRGVQGGEILVAKEMYVPSNENGWPPKPGDPEPEKPKSLKEKFLGKGGSA